MPQMVHRKSPFLVLGVLVALVAPAKLFAQEPHAPHWTYEGPDGPKHWGELDTAYAICSNGHQQSPINITDAKVADLPALKIDYSAVPLSIVDNGTQRQTYGYEILSLCLKGRNPDRSVARPFFDSSPILLCRSACSPFC
jgi:carbonic anhydrase